MEEDQLTIKKAYKLIQDEFGNRTRKKVPFGLSMQSVLSLMNQKSRGKDLYFYDYAKKLMNESSTVEEIVEDFSAKASKLHII